jgi:hypothetical protein
MLVQHEVPSTSRGLGAFNMEVDAPDQLKYLFKVNVPGPEEE